MARTGTWFFLFPKLLPSPATPSVVSRPAVSLSPSSLLEMQILKLHPRPVELKTILTRSKNAQEIPGHVSVGEVPHGLSFPVKALCCSTKQLMCYQSFHGALCLGLLLPELMICSHPAKGLGAFRFCGKCHCAVSGSALSPASFKPLQCWGDLSAQKSA